MNSYYTYGESFNHKRSNFSSFASQKINDRVHTQQEQPIQQPISYYDRISLIHAQKFALAISDIIQLIPGATMINHNNTQTLGIFQLLPLEENIMVKPILFQEYFVLRNVESNLFLAEDESLKTFTNVTLRKQREKACIFSFQNPKSTKQIGQKTISNRDTAKIKSRASNLYINLQHNNSQVYFKHIWLAQMGDIFRVKIVNRSRQLKDLLGYKDVVLLSTQIKCQKNYIGVSKSRNIFQYSQKNESQRLGIQVNTNFFQKENNEIDYFLQQNGKKRFLISSLWRIVRSSNSNQNNHNFSYLIKNRQQVLLQHVQTGLHLIIDSNNNPILDPHDIPIKLQNIYKFKTTMNINPKFQPIHIQHPISITTPIIQKQYFIERVDDHSYVYLFTRNFIPFLNNLIKIISFPKSINESREEIKKQVKFYVFLYQQIQARIDKLLDEGFSYFQYTLKLLQILKIVGTDEKKQYEIHQKANKESLILPLLIQIMKFISLLVNSSTTFTKITSEDHKKIKQIISIIFVLYKFHYKYTLNIMVSLANVDPDLIVRLLSQKINKAEHFQQRVRLIESINQIIDQFRRINFDQQNLKATLMKEHKLIIHQNTIYVTFQRKQHSIFDLFDSMSKFQHEQKLQNQQQRETYYFFYYLLSIIRILINSKGDQLLQHQSDTIENDSARKQIIIGLIEKYIKISHITVKNIILQLAYQLSSQIYNKQFLSFNKLNFIIFNGKTLTQTTPLVQILKFGNHNTLQWIFTSETIVSELQKILTPQWQKQNNLIARLRYFCNIINFLTAIIITASYDIQTVNKCEQFCIKVSTIYYRNRLNIDWLKMTRIQINNYIEKKADVIVDGVKNQLDTLISKLGEFFRAVLAQKKRMNIYPLIDNSKQILENAKFSDFYSQISLNKRIRNQIQAVYQLSLLNERRLQIRGLILQQNQKYGQCFRMIQKIIQDLDCLAIIMESFRLYGREKSLKQNMVASMKLRILNIEDNLKTVYKNKLFQNCSEAYNLSAHFFEFILQNSHEQELIIPILQSLQEKIIRNHNIFQLIHEHSNAFFSVLVDSKCLKTAKAILKWVAREIEGIQTKIEVSQYQFIYSQVIGLIEEQMNINLLFLINTIKQIGLSHPKKQEILYAKIISLPQIQQFINGYFFNKQSKPLSDKTQKDQTYLYSQQQISLHLITIFRLCSTNPQLMSHLNTLLPYDEVRQLMDNNQQYLIIKSLQTYLLTELDQNFNIELVELSIIYIYQCLSQFKNHRNQIQKYRCRPSFVKEKQGKSQTQFCKPQQSNAKTVKNLTDPRENHRSYYWEFLMWIPFYHESQGTLKNLKKLLLMVISKKVESANLRRNIDEIYAFLIEIRNTEEIFEEQHKQFLKRVNDLISIITIYSKTAKSKIEEGSSEKRVKFLEEIQKMILQNELTKPFLCTVIGSMQSKIKRTAASTVNISLSKFAMSSKKMRKQSVGQDSEMGTLRQKSHFSQIAPSQSKSHNQIKKIYEQISLNLTDFISKTQSICCYKIRLSSKLISACLNYFKFDGNLSTIQQHLYEQISEVRNIMTSYVDQSVKYKPLRRTLKADPKIVLRRIESDATTLFKLQAISLSKFQELVEENQLCILAQMLKESVQLYTSSPYKFSIPYVGTLQQILITLLRRKSNNVNALIDQLSCCQNLLDLIILLKEEEKVKQQYALELGRKLSFLIYEISFTYEISTHKNIYSQIVSLISKAQFRYMKSYESQMTEYFLLIFLQKLPPTLFYSCTSTILKMITEMLIKPQNNPTNIQSYRVLYQFIQKYFTQFIPTNFFSENIGFYEKHSILILIIQMLHLTLKNIDQSIQKLPKTIILHLVQLQHLIYKQFFQHLLLQTSDYIHQRIKLFQSTLVRIFSVIHTISLNKPQKQIQISSLYVQRVDLVGDSSLINKEIYDFYESKFGYVILRDENRQKIVQVYPIQDQIISWKPEFLDIINTYPFVQQRKQAIIQFTLMSVNQEKTIWKYQNLCHKYRPIVVISSTIILILALIQRLFHRQADEISILYKLLISINLLLVFFAIGERLMLIRKAIKMDKGDASLTDWSDYMLGRKKLFIIATIIILFINATSFIYTSYFSILLFINFYSSRTKTITFSSVIQIFKILLVMILIFFASCLIITVLSDQSSQYPFPFSNSKTDYNMSSLMLLFKVWTNEYSHSQRIYLLLPIVTGFNYILIASIIFHLLQHKEQIWKKQQNCIICQQDDRNSAMLHNDGSIHFKKQHNLFALISALKYIIKQEDEHLSLQSLNLKKLIRQKNSSIIS